MFFCEFSEISVNTFSTEHLRTAASVRNMRNHEREFKVKYNSLKAKENIMKELNFLCLIKEF